MANETSGPNRKRRGQKCPACGATSVPIVYGMPSSDLMDAADRGEVAIGGCLVTATNPTRRCEIGHEWRNRAASDPTHPVAVLRSRLASDFVDDLPDGVHPVGEWCADPQFFPGATGLLSGRSWADVVPGSAGVLEKPPPVVEDGVIVVGNYQATRDSYRRICDGSIGGFPTTWRVLRQLMASVFPAEVFLTNAFIGLPDLTSDTAPFPTTPSFTQRCQRLLAEEIQLFRPRAVVCLGVSAAKMLSTIATGLDLWQPWPGYAALSESGARSVRRCYVTDVEFTAVAVRHPSAVVSSEERERDADLIGRATSFT